MAKILIAGCGYIGSALGVHLADEGHAVWGIRQSKTSLAPSIRPVTRDLSRPVSLAQLSVNFDYVVCSVGAAAYSKEAYQTAYVDAVRNLLAALHEQKVPPKRVLFTSSTAVYGQADGSWVDETSPANSEHFSGRMMRAGERLVLESGFNGVVLRLGGIYGPGRTRLIDSVRDGSARIVEGVPRFLNLNHRDDCVGVLRYLMFLENTDPIYIGCDGNPEDRAVILRWIADQLDVNPPAVTPESGVTPERRLTNKRCSNRRLVASGYSFAYPDYRAGYGALIRAMKQPG